MLILSAGVEIVYIKPGNKIAKSVERYRAQYSSFDKLEDLLKYQIDIIAEKYKLENIISIKFTG
ncbi:hypothetical protein ES705_33690 [subsurface metagenome]